ncbi:MAG: hypothetical protein Q7R98_00890 [Candidatus Jorgensenbacteria bacterium]|nr:hypothetical protein [Candidatus Jorgensenbacteria bacterium]
MQNKVKTCTRDNEDHGPIAFFNRSDASGMSKRGIVLGLALGALAIASDSGARFGGLFISSALLCVMITVLTIMPVSFLFGRRFGIIAGFLYGICASAGYGFIVLLSELSK